MAHMDLDLSAANASEVHHQFVEVLHLLGRCLRIFRTSKGQRVARCIEPPVWEQVY